MLDRLSWTLGSKSPADKLTVGSFLHFVCKCFSVLVWRTLTALPCMLLCIQKCLCGFCVKVLLTHASIFASTNYLLKKQNWWVFRPWVTEQTSRTFPCGHSCGPGPGPDFRQLGFTSLICSKNQRNSSDRHQRENGLVWSLSSPRTKTGEVLTANMEICLWAAVSG